MMADHSVGKCIYERRAEQAEAQVAALQAKLTELQVKEDESRRHRIILENTHAEAVNIISDLRAREAAAREALKLAAPYVFQTSKVHGRTNKECPCKACEIAEKVAVALRPSVPPPATEGQEPGRDNGHGFSSGD